MFIAFDASILSITHQNMLHDFYFRFPSAYVVLCCSRSKAEMSSCHTLRFVDFFEQRYRDFLLVNLSHKNCSVINSQHAF